MALLSDRTRNATIRARTAMNVLIIPKADFDKLRQSVPAFGDVFKRAGQATREDRTARIRPCEPTRAAVDRSRQRQSGSARKRCRRLVRPAQLDHRGADRERPLTAYRFAGVHRHARAEQKGAPTIQAGHHRPDRHPRYLGDIAVAELVQLAQHDHLAQRRRERLDQSVETPQVGPAFQQRLGIDRGVATAPPNSSSASARRHPPGDCPRASCSTYAARSKQPALGIVSAIAVEIAKCPQKRLLHHIGGVGIIARHPSRERVSGIEMGQRYRFEPRPTRPIRVPDICLGKSGRVFDMVDRGRSHVETTGTPKATGPSFRAAPSACSGSIHQSRSLPRVRGEGMRPGGIKVLGGVGDLY